jgi:hypothetical protein
MKRALLLLLVLSGTAVAETKIDKLFTKAKQLSSDKKFAEACPMFEEVDKLDPGIGAKLNVARCYEDWGKLSIAYQWYVEAEKMAKAEKDKRLPKVKELVEAIDLEVPRLTITLPANIDAATAAIQLDGKPFPAAELGKEQRIDPGPHVIAYQVKKAPRTRNLTIEKGASTEIELEFGPAKGPDGKPLPEPPPVVTGPSRNWRKLSGIISGSAGIVALGVASALTLTARSSYKDALADHCGGVTNMCDDEGVRITGNAKSRANTATIISVVGGVALAAGVVLYLTAPKTTSSTERALYLTPAVTDQSAAVILGGTFR